MHALVYVSDGGAGGEGVLSGPADRVLPLSAPLSLLRAWVLRFGEPYLSGQTFLSP